MCLYYIFFEIMGYFEISHLLGIERQLNFIDLIKGSMIKSKDANRPSPCFCRVSVTCTEGNFDAFIVPLSWYFRLKW